MSTAGLEAEVELTSRFNETGVYTHAPCDVCLVSMPVVALERPSLALGILKAGAQNAGLRVRCLYPAFDFAERIGLKTYCRILDTAPDKNLGDWLFAGAAFPEYTALQSGYLDDIDYVWDAPWVSFDADTLRRALTALRLQAEQLVRDTAASAVASGARIVGCTSVFQQQGASLALLRAVKRLDPGISTMIGGANCEADMGVALHRCFSWIDFVVSGEADLLFPGLCRTILHSAREKIVAADLPEGVLGP
jgi:magnesium-protoporphyrin IX monomethyl ester (oxidative) cyclase